MRAPTAATVFKICSVNWSIMDKLHYPLAKQIQEGLTQRMEDDQQAQMTQQTPNGYGIGDRELPAYGQEGIY